MKNALYLAAGCERFNFPNQPEFGEYRGKTVVLSYSFKSDPPIIRDVRKDSELGGAARDFFLKTLAAQHSR